MVSKLGKKLIRLVVERSSGLAVIGDKIVFNCLIVGYIVCLLWHDEYRRQLRIVGKNRVILRVLAREQRYLGSVVVISGSCRYNS